MKYLIASDLHGSEYWCKKLIEALKKENADKLIFLGDVLYHGPRNDLPLDYNPKKVIEMLNSLKGRVISVRGNCDSEVDAMVLNFPITSDMLLLMANNKTVFLSHGHIYNENNLPPLSAGDVFIQGHTHVQVCEKRDGYMLLNPGSVSIPKENSKNGYIIFDGEHFVFKDFEDNEINKIKI